MDCCVTRILATDEARRLASKVDRAPFDDGRSTAEGGAKTVKNNLQALQEKELASGVIAALRASTDLVGFAAPRRIVAPMFNRYEVGMYYGRHVDAGMMGADQDVRTDFSVTLFLSDPASYDGGELCIDLPHGEETIKLDAGEAVIYPANAIHEVRPVTRGVRLAAVTWIESAISDPRLRALVSDLRRLTARAEGCADRDLALLAAKVFHDALRIASVR